LAADESPLFALLYSDFDSLIASHIVPQFRPVASRPVVLIIVVFRPAKEPPQTLLSSRGFSKKVIWIDSPLNTKAIVVKRWLHFDFEKVYHRSPLMASWASN
jgi:hypothetical protein